MTILREILAAYGGVHLEDIRGMRAPFLAIGVFIFILIRIILMLLIWVVLIFYVMIFN